MGVSLRIIVMVRPRHRIRTLMVRASLLSTFPSPCSSPHDRLPRRNAASTHCVIKGPMVVDIDVSGSGSRSGGGGLAEMLAPSIRTAWVRSIPLLTLVLNLLSFHQSISPDHYILQAFILLSNSPPFLRTLF